MGKRELVLIALFVLIGAVVYQVTAPPAPPGSDVSIGGIFQRMRRGMRGARESGEAQSRQQMAVPAGVDLLRINLPRASDVTVKGIDGDQLTVEVTTTARGYDQSEAKAAAEAAKLTLQTDGGTVVLNGNWNDRRGPDGFVTQLTATVSVPRRLKVTMLPHVGLLTVTGVAMFDGVSSRGETHVIDTTGDVQLSHNGGTLEVRGGGGLKLTTRNSRAEISGITGPARLDLTGGRVNLSELSGAVEIESRNTDVTLANSPALRAPLRYNGSGGQLRIDGLRVESRIDARNTEIDVRLAAAAPVTIYNLGAIVVTAPAAGYTLDAVASEGRISVEEPGITPTDGPDARASGKVRGGGPPLTLRSTRGRIEVRKANLQ
jgi:hypothetical protein